MISGVTTGCWTAGCVAPLAMTATILFISSMPALWAASRRADTPRSSPTLTAPSKGSTKGRSSLCTLNLGSLSSSPKYLIVATTSSAWAFLCVLHAPGFLFFVEGSPASSDSSLWAASISSWRKWRSNKSTCLSSVSLNEQKCPTDRSKLSIIFTGGGSSSVMFTQLHLHLLRFHCGLSITENRPRL